MTQRPLVTLCLAGLVSLATVEPSRASAATWTAFGPEISVIQRGTSAAATYSFGVLNPSALYVLVVRRASGSWPSQGEVEIVLNGRRVPLGPISSWLPVAGWPVRLLSSNQLAIALRGSPGDRVTTSIIGLDLDRPTITATATPPPNASAWLKTNAIVSFNCADATSGVASCTAPVTLSGDGANQVVTGTVVDKAGLRASTTVSVSVDKTAPTVQAAISPPPNASGWSSGPVTVTFACADGLSGIASCSPPVAVGTPGSHLVTGVATDVAGNQTSLETVVKVATSFFAVRSYGGKCLDAGPSPQPGGGVYLRTCDGSTGQQFRVEELHDGHRVRLHVGSTVLGYSYDPTAVIDDGTGGSGVDEGPLTLRTPANVDTILAASQVFVLDGDSIIAAADRSLVAQVHNARGADGTPIVLGKRRLADAEFWDFIASDGSGIDPTRGFVRVETICDLLRHLPLAEPGQPPDHCAPGGPSQPAHPGTVLRIAPGAVLEFSGLYPVQIPSGVTIRGGRRGLDFGPRFCKALACDENNPMDAPGSGAMLEVIGRDVRVTGLRLEGPSRRTDPDVQTTRAVLAHDGPQYARTIIDHNDVSGWTGGGIDVLGPDADAFTGCDLVPPQTSNVLVARNFLHHNRQQEKGYGVVTANGGFPLIEGNTFVANRHAIAAAGGGHTGYFARRNLVLSEVPLQDGPGPANWRTHDFDQHGNGDNGFGDRAGLYNEILGNTFFGTNRANYEIRGHPCYRIDFSWNVSLQSADDAVVFEPYMILPTQPASEVVNIFNNQFDSSHPANHLGVGDFDGDGADDLFLATGAAWFYSPAGAREWRYLSGNGAPLAVLRFGDFDGDGRTDVVTVAGSDILVSWGGASSWERLNDAPGPVAGLVVGRFVSDLRVDRRDDLFFAGGGSWLVSSSGSGPFLESQTSSLPLSDLRFGDFDGDGLTDVFGITGGSWQVSYGATSTWTPLPVSLTTSPDGLFVADFDGDGHADVARATDLEFTASPTTVIITAWTLSLSFSGATGWSPHVITPTASCGFGFSPAQLAAADLVAGIGRFDGGAGADLLLWGAKDGNNLCLVSGGTGSAERHSSQDMR